MKKFFLSILGFALFTPFSHAAIDPVYKECEQRGYEVTSPALDPDGVESCVFPDGEKCPLEAFNAGTCGQKYKTENYCVPKGETVWDEDKCCEGLTAYLPDDMPGQATCEDRSSTWEHLKERPVLLIYILPTGILLVLLVIVKTIKKFKKTVNNHKK